MKFGKRSTAMTAALAGSVLMLLGACLLALGALRSGLPLLVLGLSCNLGLVAFLWRTVGVSASRCADLERRRSKAEAEAALLRSVLEAAGDGVLAQDGTGRVLSCSESFLALWGLPGDALEGPGAVLDQDRLLAQLKDPEGWQAGTSGARAGLGPWSEVAELWDGRVLERQVRPLQGPGTGQVWSFRDITARAKADLFIHRLAQSVEQSPVSIIITDTAGTLEFVNPKFSQLTGYALEEVLGGNPRILKSGLMAPSVYEDLWATITAGGVWEGELQNRKKDGELFWERATIAPLRNGAGVITHYLGLKEDITHQKQLEHQLRHAQKLEAVGLLAGGVAHDFNNVLQVINGYGTLMQMAQAPADPHRNSLSEILKAAERAAQLTHSLLAFSRKQVMKPRTMDLNTVVGNVEKLLRRVIGEDVQLRVNRLDALLQVHVDLGQIEQVLLNLAANARDAMPKGGRLTIATDLRNLDEQFQKEHRFGRPGAYALLTVQDSGEGMDEATARRVFEPFFTTRELGRGTGLGLAMVYGIVKQHNGYILVESAAGQGSTFQVFLPIADSAQAGPQETPVQDSGVQGSETILVAEDEPAVRGILEIVLKKYGYTVLLAEDGQEAVDRFMAHGPSIHMILMDIIMPRKSGRQAYEEIIQAHPATKVLFTSGYTADFIKNRGDLDQGMELLMKPVQPMALLRKVREILDRH